MVKIFTVVNKMPRFLLIYYKISFLSTIQGTVMNAIRGGVKNHLIQKTLKKNNYFKSNALVIASHRFLIKLRHYGKDQLYLRKIP